MKSEKTTTTFEMALKELEETVKMLENGNIELDTSLKLFERGVSLIKFCNNCLDQTEKRISILTKGEDGEIKEEPFIREPKE
jgi:exodeoxyribonuclease VII small subunit